MTEWVSIQGQLVTKPWVLGVQSRLVWVSQRVPVHIGEAARLREEVGTATAQIEQMHADLQAWEEAVASRDTELRNLQVGFPIHIWV